MGEAFGRRLAAYVVDAIIGNALFWIPLILAVASHETPSVAISLVLLAYGLPFVWLICVWLMWGAGQTPGMRLMEIKMVGPDGRPPGYARGILRGICEILSALPLWLGYFWMLWDSNQQTWHDSLSGIRVVRA